MVHYGEIFISKLELLTPLWQAILGLHNLVTAHATRRWFTLVGDGFTLLGDGSCYSATAHNCLATHHGGRTMSLTARLCSHLLEQAQDGVAQQMQRRSRTCCGGYYPGYPWQTTWATPLGATQPTGRSLAGHDAARRLPQDTGKIS